MNWKTALIAAMFVTATAGVASAQTTSGSGAVIEVQGGGFNAATSLDEAGNTDFKTGFNVGVSSGYQFNRYVALRGNVNFVRVEGRDASVPPAVAIDQVQFNRAYYGADVQFRAPVGAVVPYVFAGGGGVTVKPDTDADSVSFTKPAGKVGAGIAFTFPGSTAALFAEGTTWIYKWDEYGFDKTQYDVIWSAGVSYRFGK